MEPALEETVEPLIVTLTKERGTTALVLGCDGSGNTLYLARHGYVVTAVDTDPSALNTLLRTAQDANLGGRVKIREGGLVECVSGEWDAIIVHFVLHRFARDDAKYLLSRVQACTKNFGMNAVFGWMEEGAPAAAIKKERPDAYFLTKEFLRERYQRWGAVTHGNRVQSGGRALYGLYRK
ncbi:methyltransferase domain-containing protein [Candidatus Uhrbacteria bacterium]|nr:MAG: methyltransferase domain-containing protein [Candidatus Uhrbacteria bacterium]